MSVHVTSWVWKQEIGDPLAKLILLKIADQANDEGEAWPGQERIAHECGMHRRRVVEKIKWLVENGWLESERRGPTSNLYKIKMCASRTSSEDVQPNGQTKASNSSVGNKVTSFLDEMCASRTEDVRQPHTNHQRTTTVLPPSLPRSSSEGGGLGPRDSGSTGGSAAENAAKSSDLNLPLATPQGMVALYCDLCHEHGINPSATKARLGKEAKALLEAKYRPTVIARAIERLVEEGRELNFLREFVVEADADRAKGERGDATREDRKLVAQFVAEHGWPTGARWVRGESAAGTYVFDPLGTEKLPPDYDGWPHSRPTTEQVAAALKSKGR